MSWKSWLDLDQHNLPDEQDENLRVPLLGNLGKVSVLDAISPFGAPLLRGDGEVALNRVLAPLSATGVGKIAGAVAKPIIKKGGQAASANVSKEAGMGLASSLFRKGAENAGKFRQAPGKLLDEGKQLVGGAKKFAGDHPKLTKLGLGVGVPGAVYGAYSLLTDDGPPPEPPRRNLQPVPSVTRVDPGAPTWNNVGDVDLGADANRIRGQFGAEDWAQTQTNNINAMFQKRLDGLKRDYQFAETPEEKKALQTLLDRYKQQRDVATQVIRQQYDEGRTVHQQAASTIAADLQARMAENGAATQGASDAIAAAGASVAGEVFGGAAGEAGPGGVAADLMGEAALEGQRAGNFMTAMNQAAVLDQQQAATDMGEQAGAAQFWMNEQANNLNAEASSQHQREVAARINAERAAYLQAKNELQNSQLEQTLGLDDKRNAMLLQLADMQQRANTTAQDRADKRYEAEYAYKEKQAEKATEAQERVRAKVLWSNYMERMKGARDDEERARIKATMEAHIARDPHLAEMYENDGGESGLMPNQDLMSSWRELDYRYR